MNLVSTQAGKHISTESVEHIQNRVRDPIKDKDLVDDVPCGSQMIESIEKIKKEKIVSQ